MDIKRKISNVSGLHLCTQTCTCASTHTHTRVCMCIHMYTSVFQRRNNKIKVGLMEQFSQFLLVLGRILILPQRSFVVEIRVEAKRQMKLESDYVRPLMLQASSLQISHS